MRFICFHLFALTSSKHFQLILVQNRPVRTTEFAKRMVTSTLVRVSLDIAENIAMSVSAHLFTMLHIELASKILRPTCKAMYVDRVHFNGCCMVASARRKQKCGKTHCALEKRNILLGENRIKTANPGSVEGQMAVFDHF